MDLGQQPPRRWSETLAGHDLVAAIDRQGARLPGRHPGHLCLSLRLGSILHASIPLTPAFIEPLIRETPSDDAIGAASESTYA